MSMLSRRIILGGMAAAPLAMPAIVKAKSTSKPIRIGLLSDMSGPYRDVDGPGNRWAAELAIQDFGGEVLGRKVETLQSDCQNKPDVATSIAQQWCDEHQVDVLADGAASVSSLAVSAVAKQKKFPYLAASPATSDLTGKDCSPFTIQFIYDTYALAHVTGSAMTKAGGKTWFFITADYAFGYALERDTTNAVHAAGGKVLGHVRAPLGTSDFSSYLIKAQASGAQVIGFANAGTDLQNCLKQSAEFGITKNGTKLATLLMAINDVVSLGQKTCAGLTYSDDFYWDLNPGTRAFAKRWGAKFNGMVPGLLHAGNYTSTYHWLKAVKAAGTTEGAAVVAKMKELPVNDFYNTNVKIREDGRVMNKMYLWEVKKPEESKYKYDLCKMISSVPGEEAFRPLKDDHCYFIKA